MPKQKTSSQAKKKFKVTSTGKFLRRRAGQSHNLEHKSPKEKRGFDKDVPVARANRRTVGRMLGRSSS
jgi:large subunit ribosomal protein L35